MEPLEAVHDPGQSVWLDHIRRDLEKDPANGPAALEELLDV